MSRLHAFRSTTGAVLSMAGEILGLVAQLLLLWIGTKLVWAPDDDDYTIQLLGWCVLATFYLGATIVGLNILVRLDGPDPAATRRLIGHPLTRILSTILTFSASALGLLVALDLITSIGQDNRKPLLEFSAVWAMLLSWALFNWGFARIYYSRYHRAAEPPLVFPGSADPQLTDFVYLSFTNATTFAVSDVQVVSARMRWTIVWHTSFAFFFNALIIVLSMNIIANGRLFAELFG